MPSEIIHTDVLLTNFATALRVKNPVADFIAPPFRVSRPSDKYAEYTASTLRVYDNKVKGREKPKEISWNVTSSTYECEEYTLDKFVSERKLRNADKPINLKKDAVKQLKKAQMLAREKRVFDIAGSASVVTQTAAPADWDVIATGTPVADILLGMETINDSTLEEANRIVIPLKVALNMIKTDEWKEYFKYTGQGFKKQFNAVAGLRELDLDPMITGAAGLSSSEGTGSDPALEKLWGENVLLFHADPNPTLETQTFMYSPFTKMNVISSEVVKRERGTYFNIWEEIDELLVNAADAYLFTNTLNA
jgi:hypothetical protein